LSVRGENLAGCCAQSTESVYSQRVSKVQHCLPIDDACPMENITEVPLSTKMGWSILVFRLCEVGGQEREHNMQATRDGDGARIGTLVT
jgi:hypothetical protein